MKQTKRTMDRATTTRPVRELLKAYAQTATPEEPASITPKTLKLIKALAAEPKAQISRG